MKLKLDRLPKNNLETPSYATDGAASFDLAACLSRACILDKTAQARYCPDGSISSKFNCTSNGIRALADNDGRVLEMGDFSKPVLQIAPGETILIPTGFKSEFQDGYVMLLSIRSGTSLDGFSLANGTGIIDSDYRGEIFIPVYNRTSSRRSITNGQRIAQACLVPVTRCLIEENTVDITTRGEGGFGSTGV
jgi:dUTP pyrophosphatase